MKKREYALVNMFLTNYKIHMIAVDHTSQIPPDAIHSPYRGVSASDLHTISIPSILSACYLSYLSDK